GLVERTRPTAHPAERMRIIAGPVERPLTKLVRRARTTVDRVERAPTKPARTIVDRQARTKAVQRARTIAVRQARTMPTIAAPGARIVGLGEAAGISPQEPGQLP